MVILKAQSQSHAGQLCRCGQRATSELSYAEEMQGQQDASPVSSLSGTPLSSLPTDQSYQTLPVEQVTELVPVPEDVQLPSPNSSKEEATCQGHSTPSVPSAKVAIVGITNYPHKG